jgi:hypothetical protein
MSKIQRCFLIGLTIGCFGSALADSLDIKGVKPGMSIEELKTLYPNVICHDLTNPMVDHACRQPNVTYAGTGANMTVYFLDGVSTGVSVNLDSKNFDVVVGALKEKYGNPTNIDEREIQTGMGKILTNTLLVWKRGNSRLRAERYSSKITESSVMLMDDKSVERSHERKTLDTKKRSEDL